MYIEFYNGFINFMGKASTTQTFMELIGALVLVILFWLVRNLTLYL